MLLINVVAQTVQTVVIHYSFYYCGKHKVSIYDLSAFHVPNTGDVLLSTEILLTSL